MKAIQPQVQQAPPTKPMFFTNGDHADFTQSPKLATYRNYEQVFVGLAGPIAFSQLEDLGRKAAERSLDAGNVRVTILGTPNNPAVGEDLDGKLAAAPDDAARAKVQAKIDQRTQTRYRQIIERFTCIIESSLCLYKYYCIVC